MNIKHVLCALALAALAGMAAAQQPAGGRPQIDPATLTEAQIAQTQLPEALYRLASVYKQSGDIQRLEWTLKRLIVLLPNNGDLKLALASAYAQQGDRSHVYELLLMMQQQGLGYDLANDKSFAKVSGTKVWDYAVDVLKKNLAPFGEGKVAFTLPKGDYLFDSLAFDPQRQQFLVGSVREGSISRVGKDGKLTDFIKPDAANGLWSVYAMAADPEHDALYVASTASVYFKKFTEADYGNAGVFKFSLSSGKLLKKYLLAPDPKPRTLSSIAVGKDGALFAADGLRNIIYRVDGESLAPMVENPRLKSIRGLAVSGDGKTLYFADYMLGVFGVDLAAGKAFDLDFNPAVLSLGGIDGVYWYDGALVVVENGMSPRRIMRLTLGPDGRSVVKAMPLDVASPELKLATYGAIDGDGLYVIANSQRNAYDAYGTPKSGTALEPVRVFRSNLRFAWDEVGINTRRPKPKTPAGPPPLPALGSTTRPGTGVFRNVVGGATRAVQP